MNTIALEKDESLLQGGKVLIFIIVQPWPNLETTATEIKASPLMSFQTHKGKSKNLKASLPYHQSLVLTAFDFHYEMNFENINST